MNHMYAKTHPHSQWANRVVSYESYRENTILDRIWMRNSAQNPYSNSLSFILHAHTFREAETTFSGHQYMYVLAGNRDIMRESTCILRCCLPSYRQLIINTTAQKSFIFSKSVMYMLVGDISRSDVTQLWRRSHLLMALRGSVSIVGHIDKCTYGPLGK